MRKLWALAVIILQMNAMENDNTASFSRKFSSYIPRSFCSERLSDVATVAKITLPISIGLALADHTYTAYHSPEIFFTSKIPTTLAAIHAIATLGLYGILKLGRKAGHFHDTTKFKKWEDAGQKKSSTKKASSVDEPLYVKNDLLIQDENKGLVPNDIRDDSPKGTWSRICARHLNQVLGKPLDPETFIRKALYFVPEGTSQQDVKPIVFVVTHGTFGSQTPSYYKDYAQFPENMAISPQNFRHIERFATRYATEHKRPLTLLSFRWSGDLDNDERLAAGKFLAAVLNEHFKEQKPALLGHSHGCNINRHATRHLAEPVILLINIAPPYRAESEYRPKDSDVVHSISLISPHDIIARGGQIPESIIPLVPLTLKTTAIIGASFFLDNFYARLLRVGLLSALWLPCITQAVPYIMYPALDAPQEAAHETRIVPILDGSYPGHSQMADITRYLWNIYRESQKRTGLSKQNVIISTQTSPPTLEFKDLHEYAN